MSLLSIIQSVAPRFGIAVPSIAASSTDLNITQMVAFVNEDGQELGARHNWQAMTQEATFTTVATESQGSILTLAGAALSRITNETMWNRTQQRPVFGPKSPAEWQQLKAQLVTGPWQQYRIRGNTLLFTPAPAAGQSVYFEWITKNWASDSTGVTGKQAMTADTDISLLDERLHILGTVWRFKLAKKLSYQEDYDKYEMAVSDAIGRDATKPRLQLGGSMDNWPVLIVASAGSWPL